MSFCVVFILRCLLFYFVLFRFPSFHSHVLFLILSCIIFFLFGLLVSSFWTFFLSLFLLSSTDFFCRVCPSNGQFEIFPSSSCQWDMLVNVKLIESIYAFMQRNPCPRFYLEITKTLFKNSRYNTCSNWVDTFYYINYLFHLLRSGKTV